MHAKQRQAVDGLHLLTEGLEFALDIAEQLAAPLADEALAGVRQLQQARPGFLQRLAIAGRARAAGAVDVLAQLFQCGEHLAFGLQQQALRVAGQLAGGQQLVGAEVAQLLQAGPQLVGQLPRQLLEGGFEGVDGLGRRAVLHGIAAGQVGLDVVGHLALELLRQRQVTLHQLHRLLQRTLRPPQGRRQGDADGDQQQGIEVGEQLEAHGGLDRRLNDARELIAVWLQADDAVRWVTFCLSRRRAASSRHALRWDGPVRGGAAPMARAVVLLVRPC